jgi:hypothetical protein
VGRDDDEPVTQTNVEGRASSFADITITEIEDESGDTLTRKDVRGADSEFHALEPPTLEPNMSVRGLAMAVHIAPAVPAVVPPLTQPSAGAGAASEDDEDRTTQNIEAHLLDVYEREHAAKAAAVPSTKVSPIVITPSEPFRVTSSGPVRDGPRDPSPVIRRRTPIPAAGRPVQSSEPDISEVITAPRVQGLPTASADDDDEADEDTVTDAMRSRRVTADARDVAALAAAAEAAAALRDAAYRETIGDGDLDDETRTSQKVQVSASVLAAARIDESREAQAALDNKAAAGGTVKMYFNPATGKASPFADTEQSFAPNPPIMNTGMPAHAPPPAFPMAPGQAPFPAPVIVQQVPAFLETTRAGRPRRKRRRGRVFLVFLIAFGAAAAAVFYRDRLPERITQYLPEIALPGAPGVAPTPSVVPAASEAPSATATSPSSEATAASAAPSAVTAPSATAAAVATASGAASSSSSSASASSSSASASAAASASASAAASAAASAQRAKKLPVRPPPPPPPIRREKPRTPVDDRGF